jgi:tetratricopeptide (TPR) repeat protein
MARDLGAEELALAIFKQVGAVSPQRLSLMFEVGGEWLKSPERLERVAPHDVEAVLAFAESEAGMSVAVPLSQHAERLLEESPGAESRSGQMGRIQRLRGENATALELFEKAVVEEPLAWRWRIYEAETKFDLGRREEALRDLEEAVKVFPRQSAIRVKLINLHGRALPPSR